MGTTTGGITHLDREEWEKYIKNIGAVNTLEEFYKIERPRRPGFHDVSEAYWANLNRIMSKRLEEIRTPEDVLAAHQYFRSFPIYSRSIQESLGDIAQKIIGSWHPSPGGSSIRD